MKNSLSLTILALSVALALPASADRPGKRLLSRITRARITVVFTRTPISEVIEYLREISGVNIILDPRLITERSEAELCVTLSLTGVSVKRVIDLAAMCLRLEVQVNAGYLLVSTPERLLGPPVRRIYDVRDLIFQITDFAGPTIGMSQGRTAHGRGMVSWQDHG